MKVFDTFSFRKQNDNSIITVGFFSWNNSRGINISQQKIFVLGAVILTKNAYINKYKYPGYAIGFDRRSISSFPGGGFGRNVLIFGVNMSSSSHINIKKKTY